MIDRCWKMYFYRIDKLLVENRNSPDYLKNEQIARMVAATLEYYDENEYNLLCHCIMPNHVHTVFTLLENARQLEKIMFSIKRYTAGEANKILNRKGQFWQHESYDHIIRNERELDGIVNYVLSNPVEAGLVNSWQQWQWSHVNNRIL
jgi:REP element-mobilizing transposase RayT